MKDDDACEEVREIKMMKDDVIKEMFENMKHSAPQAIPWKTYCKTVRIISSQNNVFRDFIKSRSLFKLCVFTLIDMLYIDEIVPESMRKTVLTQIYKRKGDGYSVKSYQFIHGHGWPSKLVEKYVVALIAEMVDMKTPEGQIGGIRGQSTRDHLMAVMCLMRSKEAESNPSVITLVDIAACFDKIRLQDGT